MTEHDHPPRPPRRPVAALVALGAGLGLAVGGLGAAGFLPRGEQVVVLPTPTPAPTTAPTPAGTPDPSASPTPVPTPTPRTAVATRVTIPRLRIDLPVIPENAGYPLCGVALYSTILGQPGQGRATYLSAHARAGMFGPIYERVIEDRDPASLLGTRVFVWASDGLRFEYEIAEVRTDQTSVAAALGADREELWLQTSEGPPGTVGVTQVIALPVGSVADPAGASPSPRPVVCG